MNRILRIILAICFFVPFTLYFIDFAELYPKYLNHLMRIQIVPAYMTMSLAILTVLGLLTLLFGRIYCSVICPLGVFQDIVAWIGSFFQKKKKYGFRLEKRFLRIGFLIFFLVSALVGFTAGVLLLDPYSIFGRFMANLFSHLYYFGNNALYLLTEKFDIGDFYYVNPFEENYFVLILSLCILFLILYLAIRFGRLYCNSVCPVGTILGFLARFSIFRIRIDHSKCNQCGLCANQCKSSCIDDKDQKVDMSRCVVCFNCLGSCRQGALSWGPDLNSTDKNEFPIKIHDSKAPDHKKRDFLLSLVSLVATVSLPEPVVNKTREVFIGEQESDPDEDREPYGLTPYRQEMPITPPGAIDLDHFRTKCTACHLCVSKCPADVLQPATLEYGLAGIMQPQMIFKYGFCNFDCTLCTEICPNGALVKLTLDQKHREQVGQVQFIKENCIVFAEETSCGACSEHCPTQAVRMIPYKGDLTIPEIDPDICVGCGGCEHICPARPWRAIYIEGNRVHLQAKPFKEAEKKEVKLNDFGF